MEMIGIGFAIVMLLGLFTIPGIIVVWILRRAKGGPIGNTIRSPKAFVAAVESVGGQPVKGAYLLQRGDAVYRLRYIANSEGPSHIRVGREIAPQRISGAYPELPAMRLRPENDRDRLGKRLLLNRELQTGDDLFDARIYVECDEQSGASKRILSDPEVRKGVTGLLALGFLDVGFRAHSAHLVATWRVGAVPFDADVINGTVDRLAQIADHLPPFRKVPTRAPLPFGGKVLGAAWLVAVVAMCIFFVADHRWEPLGSGLDVLTIRVGLILLLLHTGMIWALVRGHSRALRHFGWGAAAGLLFAPCLSRAVMVTANGMGDEDITTYERVLDHKRKVTSDDSTSYYFYFPTVPGVEDSSLKLSVSSREFNAATKGDTWLLTVGAGKLGTPWLLDMEPVDQ